MDEAQVPFAGVIFRHYWAYWMGTCGFLRIKINPVTNSDSQPSHTQFIMTVKLADGSVLISFIFGPHAFNHMKGIVNKSGGCTMPAWPVHAGSQLSCYLNFHSNICFVSHD